MTRRFATALAAVALLCLPLGLAQGQEDGPDDAGATDASHDTMRPAAEDHDATAHDQGADDHDTHDHASHDHASHNPAAIAMDGNANLIAVGGLDLRVEPMLDLDGRFAVVLSVLHAYQPTKAPVQGVLETPNGEKVTFAGTGAMVVTDVVEFEQGMYVLDGAVGDAPFSVEMSAHTAATDLDSELVMFLVPHPAGAMPVLSHVVLYAFADGENIHQRFALTRDMPAMDHDDEVEEFLMMHSHFVHVPLAEVPGEEAFDPMSNEVTIPFGMAGEWVVNVVIGTGFSAERATFEVPVDGR